jgi:hypothetical protein
MLGPIKKYVSSNGASVAYYVRPAFLWHGESVDKKIHVNVTETETGLFAVLKRDFREFKGTELLEVFDNLPEAISFARQAKKKINADLTRLSF